MTSSTRPGDAPSIPVEKRLVAINSLASVLGHVVNLVLLIWLQQFLLENVPIEEYAVYLLVITPLLLVPLLAGSLTTTVGRFVVVHLSEGNEKRSREVVATTVLLSTGLAALLAVPGALLYVWIQPALGIDPRFVSEARTMFALLAVLTTLRIVTAPLVVGPFVRQRYVLRSSLRLATQFLRIGLIVTLLLCIEVRVIWVVVATVLAEGVGLVATVLVSRRLVPALRFRLRDATWDVAPVLTAFGGWSFLRSCGIVVRRTFEPVLLNRMGGALDVTCFHLGGLVMSGLQTLMNQAIHPLEPPLAALHARGDVKRLREAYLRGNRLALLMGLFVAAPVIVYQRELVLLYVGDRFLDAGIATSLLVVQLPLRWSGKTTGILGAATNRMRPVALGSLALSLSILVAVAVSLALGGGAVAAAAASLVATALVQTLVVLPIGWRIAGVGGGTWFRSSVLPTLAPLVFGAGTWYGIRLLLQPQSWVMLGACFGVGAVVFLAAALIASSTAEDRRDLSAVFAALTGRRSA